MANHRWYDISGQLGISGQCKMDPERGDARDSLTWKLITRYQEA